MACLHPLSGLEQLNHHFKKNFGWFAVALYIPILSTRIGVELFLRGYIQVKMLDFL